MIFEKTLEAPLCIIGLFFSLSSCGLEVRQAFLVDSQVAVGLPCGLVWRFAALQRTPYLSHSRWTSGPIEYLNPCRFAQIEKVVELFLAIGRSL